MQAPKLAPALLFSCCRLLLSILHELSCKPSADRFVIQLQTEECQCDARYDDKCGNSQAVVERVNIILNEPSVEDIHNRVVYDVKGV